MLIRATCLLPIDGPPIKQGMVRVNDGLITEIGTQRHLLPDEALIELPDHILLPGFINTHTHLDLSNTHGPLPRPTHYTEWVGAVMALRRQFSADDLATGLITATQQLLRGGSTTVGDFVGDLRILPLLAHAPFTGHAFVELIANGPARLRERQAELTRAQLEPPTHAWPLSLTPHALHTVERLSLQTLLLQHAAAPRGPLAIHCAESPDEVALFTQQRGPLHAFMATYGYHYGPPVDSPIHFLQRHGGVPKRSCLIHCNYLLDRDIAAIRESQSTVIHCPQSHRYFGYDPFPLDRLHEAGVPIALGTDGLPSAASLNMLTELRLLRQKWPQLSAQHLVTMATRTGAEALWYTDRGRLALGARADLIAVPFVGNALDPYEAVLNNTETTWTMIGGTIVRDIQDPTYAV